MLTYRSIKPFDGWFDAGMNFAKLVVKIWVNSHHFTKTEYDGKDEFYALSSQAYTSFMEQYDSVAETHSDRISDVIDLYNKYLDTSTLTFERLLYVLATILYEIDVSRGAVSEYVSDLDDFLNQSGLSYLIHHQDNLDKSLVPFITATGIFGTNTYLYLYYHGLYPYACSIKPKPIHDNSWITGYDVMYHDLKHTQDIELFRG